VGLAIVVKDGASSDQVCLDTATTSITASAESRQVGLDTEVKTEGEPDTGGSVDTVVTSDDSGETCTSI